MTPGRTKMPLKHLTLTSPVEIICEIFDDSGEPNHRQQITERKVDSQLRDGWQVPFLGRGILGPFSSVDNEMCAGKKAAVSSLHKVLLYTTAINNKKYK